MPSLRPLLCVQRGLTAKYCGKGSKVLVAGRLLLLVLVLAVVAVLSGGEVRGPLLTFGHYSLPLSPTRPRPRGLLRRWPGSPPTSAGRLRGGQLDLPRTGRARGGGTGAW